MASERSGKGGVLVERIGVVVVTAAMLVGSAAVAPVAGQGVEVGLKAGWSATTVAWTESRLGDTFDELRRRNAISGGAFAVFPLTAVLRLRVEAL